MLFWGWICDPELHPWFTPTSCSENVFILILVFIPKADSKYMIFSACPNCRNVIIFLGFFRKWQEKMCQPLFWLSFKTAFFSALYVRVFWGRWIQEFKGLTTATKALLFLQVSNTAAIMESTSLRHCLCWKLDSNLRRITEQTWEVLLDKIGSSYFFEWTVPCLLSRVLNLGNLKEKKKPQRQQSSCF